MASLKKNSIYNTVLNICNVIYPLITAPYIARVLDPDGVGLVNFATTYANYFALVAVLGIPIYGIRAVAKVRENKDALNNVVSELITISLLSTIVVTVVFLLTLVIIDKLNESFILFLVAGIVIYLAPLRINWYYQGVEKFDFITLRTLVIRVLSIIALFTFVRTKSDIVIFVLIYVLGSVIGDIWNYIKLYGEGLRPRIKISGLRNHIRPIFLLFTSSVAISIYTVLDTVMLGFMSDYSEVGFYNSASHMSKAIVTLVTSASAVLIPRVSYYFEKGLSKEIDSLIEKAFSFQSFIAFPCAIGLFCVAPVFVPLFLGDSFKGSIIPLQILSFLILSIGLNNFLGTQVLVGLGKDAPFMKAVIIGAITNFALNSLLIPHLGANGASISSLIAETIIALLMLYMVKKHTFIRIKLNKEMFQSLLFSLFFIPITYILSFFTSGWLFVLVSTICCGSFYILFQYIVKNSSLLLALSFVLEKN